jgi:hypothetical protein
MTAFHNQLLQVQRQQKKVQDMFFRMNALAENGQREEANEESFHLVVEAEKLTNLTRELIASTGRPNAREMLNEHILKSVPVSIKYTPEGWFMMSMPALMPCRKRGNMDYLRGYLYPFLERFMEENPRREFGKSVIVFRHIYDHERPERQFRDHDNYEINTVVDAVAFYLLPSDGPMYLDHFYCTAPGEADGTEVYLVPWEDFERFYLALEAGEIGVPEAKTDP